ncbi:MAG: DUF4411 family protein [bacterium]|nr:DUF4411 family protein [bacterium]
MIDDSKKETKFLVDTNVLIGFSLWTPIPLNGGFWNKLEEALGDGKWVLLDVVVKEIKYNPDLVKWCEKQKNNGLVKKICDDDKYRAIEINSQYKMIDEVTQKSTVDTYLIAYAEANNLGIFSRESPRSNSTDLYKIPDVCDELKIERIKQPMIFLKKIGFKPS